MKNEEVIIFIAKQTGINEVYDLMMQKIRELSVLLFGGLSLRGLYSNTPGPTLRWLCARLSAWCFVCSTPLDPPAALESETDFTPIFRAEKLRG